MKGRSDQPYGPYVAPGTTRPSLVGGLRIRNPESWELFVRLYGPWVFRRALAKIGNPDDAADTAQRVIMSVLKALPNFRGDRQAADFRRWLNTLTQAEIANHFRKVGRQKDALGGRMLDLEAVDPGRLAGDAPGGRSDGEDAAARQAEEASGDDLPRGSLVRSAFDLLQRRFEEKTVEAARLRLVERLSAAVVAERLEMSCAAVHVAVSRVRKALRELLDDPLRGTSAADAE